MAHVIERAPTGRAKCRGCNGRIAAKELRFTDYRPAAGRVLLARMEVDHLLPTEKGMRTILEFTDHEARPLPPDLFAPEAARALP